MLKHLNSKQWKMDDGKNPFLLGYRSWMLTREL